jgi:hypothetical protein
MKEPIQSTTAQRASRVADLKRSANKIPMKSRLQEERGALSLFIAIAIVGGVIIAWMSGSFTQERPQSKSADAKAKEEVAAQAEEKKMTNADDSVALKKEPNQPENAETES